MNESLTEDSTGQHIPTVHG